jgi:hypothetical protein
VIVNEGNSQCRCERHAVVIGMDEFLTESGDGAGPARLQRHHGTGGEVAVACRVRTTTDFQRQRDVDRIENLVDTDIGGEFLIAHVSEAGQVAVLRLPGIALVSATGIEVESAGPPGPAARVRERIRGHVPVVQGPLDVRRGRGVVFNREAGGAVRILRPQPIPRPGGRRVEHLHAVLVRHHRGLDRWGERARGRGPRGERAHTSQEKDEHAGHQYVALGPSASPTHRPGARWSHMTSDRIIVQCKGGGAPCEAAQPTMEGLQALSPAGCARHTPECSHSARRDTNVIVHAPAVCCLPTMYFVQKLPARQLTVHSFLDRVSLHNFWQNSGDGRVSI